MSIFCAVWLVCGAALLVSIGVRAPYGDLTRVGALSEDLFGWRARQPAVPAALLVSAPVPEADVLVVGDSYSLMPGPRPDHGLLWQSRLVQAGYRVATMHWDRAHPFCPDFDDWLRSLGFHGRWVLIESVEREVDGRLAHPRPCSGPARPGPAGFTVTPPPTSPPPFTPNWHEKLFTGVVMHWHSFQARTAEGSMTFRDPASSDAARLRPVPDGCRRFSHTLCDRALFLANDDQRPRLQPSHVTALAKRSASPRPWHLGWVMVPNKTTLYVDPDPVRAAFADVSAQGLGPDVLAALRAAETGRRDLYFPNDSHLSTEGNLVLGDAVVRWLSDAQRITAR